MDFDLEYGEKLFLKAIVHNNIAFFANLSDTNYINMCNRSNTLTTCAIYYNRVEIAKIIIDAGAVVDKLLAKPFYWAVHRNHIAMVKLLVNNSMCIDTVDKRSGLTPLMVAARFAHNEIVKILLDAGALIDKPGPDGKPILCRILNTDTMQIIVNECIERKCKYDGIDCILDFVSKCQLLLIKSVILDDMKMVKFLLTIGTDINCVDNIGFTPLWYAVWHCNFTMCEYLVKNGANVNHVYRMPNSQPLQYAIYNCNYRIVKLLIDNGTDIHTKHNGKSIMDYLNRDTNAIKHYILDNAMPELVSSHY